MRRVMLLFAATAACTLTVDTPARAMDWSGVFADIHVTRPLNSTVIIDDNGAGLPGTPPPGLKYNLTGIHVGGTAALLFDPTPWLVVGPRVKIEGGSIESMPFDFTVRTNAIATLGVEAGVPFRNWLPYAYFDGGIAWTSLGKAGHTQDNLVSAYVLGLGARIAVSQTWYAKVEWDAYTVLGDQRIMPPGYYADPRYYMAIRVGFGHRFQAFGR